MGDFVAEIVVAARIKGLVESGTVIRPSVLAAYIRKTSKSTRREKKNPFQELELVRQSTIDDKEENIY